MMDDMFQEKVKEAVARNREGSESRTVPDPVVAGECFYQICGFYCDSPMRNAKFCRLDDSVICPVAVGMMKTVSAQQ